MDYKEFAQTIKKKYPQYNNVDDMELAKRVVDKYPTYKEQVTFEVEPQETNQGIDLKPSRLVKAIPKAIATPFIANKENTGLKEAYDIAGNRLQQLEKEHPITIGGVPKAVDFGLMFALPQLKLLGAGTKGANLVNGLVNGLYQGGLIGGIDSLAQKGDLSGIGTGATMGGTVGAGLPIIGKTIQSVAKPIGNITKWTTSKLTSLNPETIEQAIKPNSRALDLTNDTAENLLMNTTERVRNAYNNVLNKRGEAVGRALNNLPDNGVGFRAGDLIDDYEKLYADESLSGIDRINPAKRATKNEYEQIKDMIYGDMPNNLEIYKQGLEEMKYPKVNLEVQRGKKKGQFWSHTLQNENNDISIANRRFNEEILGTLKQHPEYLQDPGKIAMLENQISKYSVPEEYAMSMYDKLYEAIGKGNILDKANRIVGPKELYDINKNIANMTNFDIPMSDIRNKIPKRIYGVNAERLSSLSPELAEANKAYSEARNMLNNEGLKQILKPSKTLGSTSMNLASRALKNYNSTMTKGNVNRNVQDLENLLTNEGYAPFLNDINDVNSAQEMLNQLTTGRNFLGMDNLLKGLAKIGLKSARAINRKPEIVNALNQGLQKTALPLTYGLTQPLKAGIVYNENR